MDKSVFNRIIKDGMERGKDFLAVKIETEGNPGPEVIINPAVNFNQKIKYYQKEYNDNMELIVAKEKGKIVKIVDVLMTSNLNDISWFAY